MGRKRATSVDAVLAAAAQVFEQRGYANATIDDIAEAAGITKPTVYQYLKSKRWALDRIVVSLMQGLEVTARDVLAADEPPLHRLREYIELQVRTAVQNAHYYRIVFGEQAELSAGARRSYQASARRVTQDFCVLLEECAAEGLVDPDVDVHTLANLVLGAVISMYRWAPQDIDQAQVVDQVWLMLNGVLLAPTERLSAGSPT